MRNKSKNLMSKYLKQENKDIKPDHNYGSNRIVTVSDAAVLGFCHSNLSRASCFGFRF